MSHFHYPDGRVLGKPDSKNGDTAKISSHEGRVVNAKPYGYAHASPHSNLPLQPQDPGFSPSRDDVVIKPPQHHGIRNPYPPYAGAGSLTVPMPG